MIHKNWNLATVSVSIVLLSSCSGGGGSGAPATSNLSSPPPAAPPPAMTSSNRAPLISGMPNPAANVDQPYQFTPDASDPDGDNLEFSIANQPSWASFDEMTGVLSGTPVACDAAVYENIGISVSDGSISTPLAEFSITVMQIATGSATLTWTAPTLNTDNSPLTDLRSYKINYGTRPGDHPTEITVENPGLTTYVVDGLAPDTYYFVIRSVNSQSVVSDFSNEASKTIN